MTSLHELANRPSWEWPADASKAIRAALLSGVEAEQLRAVELVAEAEVDDAMAEAVLNIISGPGSSELRSAAAISLGPALEEADLGLDDFDDDEVVLSPPVVTRILAKMEEIHRDQAQPKLLRRRVLEASVRSPQDWHPDVIRAAWATGDREWVATAVFCMGYVSGFDREIVEAMESKDAPILFEAVRAAGMAEVTGVEDRLIDLAGSATADRDLRLLAIEALGGAGDEQATDLLLELSESDDREIAETAGEALAMLEGSAGFDSDDA